MILEWIQNRLVERLNRKKQEVVRLRWQQAQLQQRLDQEKRQRAE